MIEGYPFSSTIFAYDNRTVKVKLHCSFMRSRYLCEFSCRTTIIDDHMLELQAQQHTKQDLLDKGYKYDTY